MSPRDAFQLLLLSAVWGASFILIRIAGHALPPAWVALGRLVLGGAFLWTVLLAGRRRLPPRSRLAPLLLVALFNNAIPFTFFAWGEQTVPSSLAAILNATTPLFSALIALGLRDSRLSGRAVLGVSLSFLGVGLAVSGGLRGGWGSPLGVALIAAASLGYAIATTIAKRTLAGLDPIGLATSQLSWATVMVAPLALAGPGPARLEPAALGAIAVLGVLGSGLAYLLYYGLLERVSPTQLVAVTYLLPVWGLFWGALAGEPVGWPSLLGVGVILVGLGLLNALGRPRAKPLTSAAFEGR
jgi:drug/metabolite transporter (DMT)-like permease